MTTDRAQGPFDVDFERFDDASNTIVRGDSTRSEAIDACDGDNVVSTGAGSDLVVARRGDLSPEGAPTIPTITDSDPARDRLLLEGFGGAGLSELGPFALSTGPFVRLAPGKTLFLTGVGGLSDLAGSVAFAADGSAPPSATLFEPEDSGVPGDGVTNAAILSGAVVRGE